MVEKKRKAPLKKRLEKIVQEMVGKGIRLGEAQEQVERLFLQEVMRACNGNQCRAAERLEIHRNTLRRKLQGHELL